MSRSLVRGLGGGVLLVLTLLWVGCAQQAGFPGDGRLGGERPGDHDGSPGPRKTPAQLQLEVMDFSDYFVASTWAALAEILAVEKNPERRVAILTWKVRYASAAMEIGSGADPRTSLLDMAIFISAGRWALANYWIPQTFGPEGERLRPVYAELDRRVWELVSRKLSAEQVALLRELIAQWTRENPPNFEIATVRFRNLEGVQAEHFQAPRNARGLLAGVRAWLGEVNTSLLFGERVLFYLERTPRLLHQQTDLTLAQIAQTFPITQVEPDFPALSEYIETLPERMVGRLIDSSKTDEALPDLANLGSLTTWPVRETLQETQTLVASSTDLVRGATELVTASTALSGELQTVLNQVSDLEARLALEEVDWALWEPRLAELTTAIRSLQSSLASVEALLAVNADGHTALHALWQDSAEPLQTLLDGIFLRLAGLVLLIFLFGCAWILLARWAKKSPATVSSTPPPGP